MAESSLLRETLHSTKDKKKNVKVKNELMAPHVQLTAVGKFNGQQKGKIGSRKNFDTEVLNQPKF